MAAIHYEATYAAPVERVMTLLTDESFLAAYAKEVGALAHVVDVERDAPQSGVRTLVTMTVATQGVPAVLKRLVTSTVDITEARVWQLPASGECRGSLAVDASARGRHAKVRGSLLLTEGPSDATRFVVDGAATVAVPLLGDMAAGLVKDLVGSVIRRQTVVMERWLNEI